MQPITIHAPSNKVPIKSTKKFKEIDQAPPGICPPYQQNSPRRPPKNEQKQQPLETRRNKVYTNMMTM
jgi:hypothetical protein